MNLINYYIQKLIYFYILLIRGKNIDTFQNEVFKIPKELRFIETSSIDNECAEISFGLPYEQKDNLATLELLPTYITGFNFYLGGSMQSLMSSFSTSVFPSKIEHLSIGNSSYAESPVDTNYIEMIEVLESCNFINLKSLCLGCWELFCNSHCLYGKLGDITSILKNSPNLEYLGLYGNFQLSQSLSLNRLKDLTIELDDPETNVNGGFITQSTLDFILESQFSMLEEVYIDLECDKNDYSYTFPNKFLEGLTMPQLKKIEIAGGFANQEKERLLKSPLINKNNIKFCFDGMVVS